MPTELQFRIPVSLDLDTTSPPANPLQASFVSRGFKVDVALSARTGERTSPFEAAFTFLTCHVSAPTASEAALTELANDPAALLDFVMRCTNRILTALRNSGLLHTARPLSTGWESGDPTASLYSLDLARRESEDAAWSAQYVPGTLESMLMSHFHAERQRWPSGTLMVSRLPHIERAIERGARPTPEDEFYVNALEHLENGNLRIAVIESIICLELCIADWMKLWLMQRGVAERDIGEYFSKDVGIAARVAVMVPLMRHESVWHTPSDTAPVLRLIKYRNAIAHKTGRLDGINESELRRLIGEAIKLAFEAAREAETIRLQPVIQEMTNGLKTLVGRTVRLQVWATRLYVVSFEYAIFEAFPSDSDIRAIIDKISEYFRERDRWFDRDQQLHLHINQGNRTIVYFRNGVLENVAKPLAPQSLLSVLGKAVPRDSAAAPHSAEPSADG